MEVTVSPELVTPVFVPLDLDLPLFRIVGIGKVQAQRLEKLGLSTVQDLLFHLPRRYEDTRETVPLRALTPGSVQTAHVRIRNISARKTPYKKMVLVEATLEDDGAVATAVWFNQPFLLKQLHPGDELMVNGKVERARTGLSFRNPTFEHAGPDQHHVGTIAPIYPETQGISSRFLRGKIEPLLGLVTQVPDRIPPAVRDAEDLMPIAEALYQVHVPDSIASANKAKERIAFEEMFLLQIAGEG